ncbi:MAG: autotransporter-associated beta strand repeat-containing protein [Luteolibacter sp.]
MHPNQTRGLKLTTAVPNALSFRTDQQQNSLFLGSLLLCTFLSVNPSQAASRFWDGTDTTANADGGTGTWNLATANWDTLATAGANSAFANADTANFGGTADTVTLGTSLNAAGLVFTTTGYTIAGGANTLTIGASGIDASALSSGTTTISGAITMSGNQAWNVGTGSALSMTGAVNGGGTDSTKTGAGTLNLSGGTSASMRTFGVNSGTLNITAGSYTFGPGSPQGIAAMSLGSGASAATFSLSGGSVTLQNGAFNMGASNSAGTGATIFTISGGTFTSPSGIVLSGAGGSSGTINLDGGTLSLGSAITNGSGTGTFNFNGGTFKASSGSAGLTSLTNAFVKAGGAIFDTSTNGFTISQVLKADTVSTGGGLTTTGGAGTLTLSANNTYTGDTNIGTGTTLTLSNSLNIAFSTLNYVTTGGTLSNVGSAQTFGGLSGNKNLTIANGSGNRQDLTLGANTATYSGILDASALTKIGTGVQTLSGLNIYAGATTISAGTLVAGNNASSSSGTAGAFGKNSTAITLGNAATTTNNSSAALLIGGAFTVARPVTIANQATTGTYTIGGSTDSNAIFSGLITMNKNLTVSQVATTSTNTLTLSGNIQVLSNTLTFNNAGAVSATGQLTSSNGTGGTLIKTGAGTLLLTNATNNYTGTNSGALPLNGTQINQGVLGLSADLNLGLTGGGAFQQILFTGSGTLQDTTNNISLNSFRTIGINTGATATFDSNGNTFTINGIIQNNASNTASGIAKAGAGTVVLAGANSYSGTTTINAGTLSTGGSNIPDGSAVTLANTSGTILNLTGSETIASLAGGGTTGGNVTLNANKLTTGDSTSTNFGGVISGSSASGVDALVKNGSGRFTLSGANTLTGQIIVNTGTLQFGDGTSTAGSASSVSTIFVNNSPTVAINKTNGGSINNTIASNPSAVTTLKGNNATGTTNTFTGTSYSNGGTFVTTSTTAGAVLAFSNASAIDIKGTQLLVNGAGDTLFSGAIYNSTGSGSVLKQGTGTLIYEGAQTYTGSTAIDAGAIRVDAAPNVTGTYFLGNGGTTGTAASLVLGGSGGTGGGVTFANSVSINAGSGGNRTLAGVNSSGTTNTFSGTVFSSPSSGADMTLTSTSSGATLAFTNASAIDLKGSSATFNGAGDISVSGAIYNSTGSGSITKSGAGILTLTAANSYTGTTTVSAGTLVISGNQSTATGAVSVSGTLAGSGGTIGGNTTIEAAGHLAPGNGTANSIGTETFTGTLAFVGNSIFDWDIDSPVTNQAGADQGSYDKVVNNNATQMSGTSVFNVILGTGKSYGDAFWDTDKSWTNVFSGTGLASDLSTIFTSFSNNGTALTAGLVPGEGTFSYGITTNTLTWTAVPEPTSALAGLLIGAGLLRRRRTA